VIEVGLTSSIPRPGVCYKHVLRDCTDGCQLLYRYTLQCFPGAKEAPKREGTLLSSSRRLTTYLECTKPKPPENHADTQHPCRHREPQAAL